MLAAKSLVFAVVTFVVGEVTSFAAFFVRQAAGSLVSVHHSAHTLQPWPGFGVMCLFVAVVYAIAQALLDRRDA